MSDTRATASQKSITQTSTATELHMDGKLVFEKHALKSGQKMHGPSRALSSASHEAWSKCDPQNEGIGGGGVGVGVGVGGGVGVGEGVGDGGGGTGVGEGGGVGG